LAHAEVTQTGAFPRHGGLQFQLSGNISYSDEVDAQQLSLGIGLMTSESGQEPFSALHVLYGGKHLSQGGHGQRRRSAP
jgi:hypothetical protein